MTVKLIVWEAGQQYPSLQPIRSELHQIQRTADMAVLAMQLLRTTADYSVWRFAQELQTQIELKSQKGGQLSPKQEAELRRLRAECAVDIDSVKAQLFDTFIDVLAE